jgi:hypothetical protein
MCDKLVYDLSQEVDGSPNVFIRKDWINILDNQNQNYQNNQSIIDTSQLSNSNKYMSYREAYLMIPMVLTFSANAVGNIPFGSDATTGSLNKVVGLKNWFGQIIHSFTLDYNGTTIIQQTPFCNMWNSFKLMTSLSWNDVIIQGAQIGFYPDDPTAFFFNNVSGEASGQGTCNNVFGTQMDLEYNNLAAGNTSTFDRQNEGFSKRLNYIIYNPQATINEANVVLYSTLQSVSSTQNLWRSYISKKVIGTGAIIGYQQITIAATVYLKHLHSFFNSVPLLKGAFMKMTMNLNNASCTIVTGAGGPAGSVANAPTAPASFTGGAVNATAQVLGVVGSMALLNTSVPVGGLNPIMISSNKVNQVVQGDVAFTIVGLGQAGLCQITENIKTVLPDATYVVDLSVGRTPLSSALRSANSIAYQSASGGPGSIYLYVPAYSFNPTFEQAYLSNPVKTIKYTDIYQYQVINIGRGTQFNNLITNGISNIKSILILPLFSSSVDGPTAGFSWANLLTGIPSYQSPFDPVGTGTTAPLVHFSNFNVQVSGQNAIYNAQKYTFEEWNNQLYGQNSVNGGMTDGLSSGLIDYLGFQLSQCFYYVNIERMLPVEQSVPKSIQILGQNLSEKNIDLFVFVEFGTEISVDIMTGARV